VRVVRAEHQHPVAKRSGDHVEHRFLLVRLDVAEHAPSGEMFARQVFERGGAPDVTDLLVHAPNPERQPTEAAFEHREAQTRMAVEHPASEKSGHEAHRTPRMRAQSRDVDVVPHVAVTGEIGRSPGEAVMDDRQVVLLGGLPDRFQVGMIDRALVGEQGLHGNRPFRIAPFPDLLHSLFDIACRGDDRAFEAVGERRAKLLHMTVVGADQPDFERHVGHSDHARPNGRDEKMHVRAFGIHIQDAVVRAVIDHAGARPPIATPYTGIGRPGP